MSQTSDEIDHCQAASEAALEKGLSFCYTPESRVEAFSRVVGLDPDEIDAEAILEIDPDDESEDARKRVLSRMAEIIEDGEDQPMDAISQAWNSLEIDFQGTEPEEEPEGEGSEPESDEDEPESEESEPETDEDDEPDGLDASEIDLDED